MSKFNKETIELISEIMTLSNMITKNLAEFIINIDYYRDPNKADYLRISLSLRNRLHKLDKKLKVNLCNSLKREEIK